MRGETERPVTSAQARMLLKSQIRSGAGRWGRLRGAMSAASRAALGVSLLLSGGAVVGVHVQQRRLRERLHEGVYRDLERQKYKKHFNLLDKHTPLAIQLETEPSKMLMTGKPQA